MKWSISEEKLAALKDSKNKCLCTKKLDASNIPGVKYYLSIFPNGNTESSRGEVCVFLQVDVGNELKVKGDGKFYIDSVACADELDHEYHNSEGYGFSPCITADLFDSTQKFIVDGKLIIKFEGTLTVEKPRIENEINLGTGLVANLFWMNEDKDFTIHVGQNAVKVSFNYLHYFTMPIYKFRFINAFSLFIPPFSKLCSKLE